MCNVLLELIPKYTLQVNLLTKPKVANKSLRRCYPQRMCVPEKQSKKSRPQCLPALRSYGESYLPPLVSGARPYSMQMMLADIYRTLRPVVVEFEYPRPVNSYTNRSNPNKGLSCVMVNRESVAHTAFSQKKEKSII